MINQTRRVTIESFKTFSDGTEHGRKVETHDLTQSELELKLGQLMLKNNKCQFKDDPWRYVFTDMSTDCFGTESGRVTIVEISEVQS